MTNRIQTFEGYANHPWLKRVFGKLTNDELRLARDFIQANNDLPKGDFELKVNRMFLDQATKPKHYREILELLTCTNSALKN